MQRSAFLGPFSKLAAPTLTLWVLVVSLACRSSLGPEVAASPTSASTVEVTVQGQEHGPVLEQALLATEGAWETLQVRLAGGQEDLVAATLEAYLALHPDDRRAHDLMGQARFEQGRYDDAKRHLERAVALADEDAMTHLWLGKVLAEDIDRAMVFAKLPLAKRLLGHFERAAEIDPLSVPAHTALARFHLEAPAMAGGSGERMRHHIDRLHALDAAAGHRLEARLYQRAKDSAAAERELRLAVAAAPREAENYSDLGTLLLQQGRPEEALPLLRQAVALALRPGEAHFRLAEAVLQVATPPLEEARDALLAYVQHHPTHDQPSLGEAWFQLGRVQQALGDDLAAGLCFRQTLQHIPNHRQAEQAVQALSDDG